MPGRAASSIHKIRIGEGAPTYLMSSALPDGRLGEVFINQAKLGTYARGMTDAFARLLSISLQHGVPLDRLCDAFIETKFEPAGFVEGDSEITTCDSTVDYIFKRLRKDYL